MIILINKKKGQLMKIKSVKSGIPCGQLQQSVGFPGGRYISPSWINPNNSENMKKLDFSP